MSELFNRRRLNDQWIAAVGLLVAGAVAALLGVAVLVAHRVDADSARRDVEITKGHLNTQVSRMRQDLASVAHAQNAGQRTIANDLQAIHNDYGRRLHALSGHQLSYILKPDGEALYASVNGIVVEPNAYKTIAPRLEPILDGIKHTYLVRNAAASRINDPSVEFVPEAVSRAVFQRIDHRTALVGAVTLSPRPKPESIVDRPPPIAASVMFLDESFLHELSIDLAINDLALQNIEPSDASRSSVEIPLYSDGQRVWLTWTPGKPGSAMLDRLMPALVGTALFIGLIGFVVLRHAKRANKQLAESEHRATELAFRDTLTGLGNRAHLLEVMTESMASLGPKEKLALLFIDIDGFKDINDTLGHHVGDELLTAAAWRLASVKNNKAAVRVGGDEFAILISISNDDEIGVISRYVLENLRQQTPAGDHVLSVTASIGVAIAPEHGTDPETLLRRADIALYHARSEGRGTLRTFDPGYEDALHKRGKIERELAGALTNEQLIVRFQPQYSADGERIVGVEALVRWNHPERGIVPPIEFVPIAEHSGLVVRLDEWVLRRACEEAMNWPEISLAVNLSPSNFHHSDMVARLTRVLDETGFDPHRLEIEITENTLLNATPEVLGQLSEMRQMGIRIVLDDFGTGYSSLGYLRRFPVDKIKIDKSFVQNLGITEEAAAIIECVARLGRALGLTITAEGVESSEQHRFVRAAGCHQLQGFLFSKAVDAEKISAMLHPSDARSSGDDAAWLASA
jgi:diguanylate cyclase (GGDEF)-like protein